MSKRWKLGEVEYEVQELEVGQDQEIMKLLEENDLLDMSRLTLSKLFQVLGAEQKLQRLFALILVPVNGRFELEKVQEIEAHTARLKNSAALEVAEDFFGKNRDFLSKLEGYFQNIMEMIKNKTSELEEALKKAQSITLTPSSLNSREATLA